MITKEQDFTHIKELQSVRGIAALIVVLGHCISVFPVTGLWNFQQLAVNTHAAVIMFFVLSGYVLSISLQKRGLDKRSITQFYIARAFRIFPALWVASAISLLLIAITDNYHPTFVTQWFDNRYKPERYNITFILLSFAGISAFLLPQVWSIAVEIFGSLILPLIHKIIRTKIFIFLLLFSTLYVAFEIPAGPYDMVSYVMDFSLGAAIFVHRDTIFSKRLLKNNVHLLGPLSFSILLAVKPINHILPLSNGTSHIIETFASAGLLISIIKSRFGCKFLSSENLVRIGDYSYGIYLLHFPMMYGFIHLANAYFYECVKSHSNLSNWILFSITCIASIYIGRISYSSIELPAILLGKKFLKKVQSHA